MKNILIIALFIVIGGGIYYVATRENAPDNTSLNTQGLTESKEMRRITFTYPESYVLLEQSNNTQTPTLNKTLVIMQKADYESVINGEREGGEGPASITIQEYQNADGLSARAWAEKNVQLSNFQLIMGEITETELDGNLAVRYNADGLYANRNVVFVVDDLIYYLSGAYMTEDSELYRDFDTLVRSVDIKE